MRTSRNVTNSFSGELGNSILETVGMRWVNQAKHITARRAKITDIHAFAIPVIPAKLFWAKKDLIY